MPLLRYCKRCLYSSAKPDLIIDGEGICTACHNYDKRQEIDWKVREREFEDLFAKQSLQVYDAVVPVSGGKDSHFQVLKLLDAGLNPLAVTATTDSLTPIGRRNLDNIAELGVDKIEVSVNPVIRRTIARHALQLVGDISWAEHVTIFTIPIRIAIQLGIKNVVWGENPQNEYGGPNAGTSVLSHSWLSEFGGMLGLRVSEMVGVAGMSEGHLHQYTYPTAGELSRANLNSIFLGHYFPWDGEENANIASLHGFESWPTHVEGSLCSYENLDNYQTGIHDYFKYIKFGFGRATDIASNMARRNRWSRKVALEMVREFDGQYPSTYLGRSLEEILDEIGMTLLEFEDCVLEFTNPSLFDVGVYPPKLIEGPR